MEASILQIGLWVLIVLIVIGGFLFVRWILKMRRVVKPSEVHIVMRKDATHVYGDEATVNPTIEVPVNVPVKEPGTEAVKDPGNELDAEPGTEAVKEPVTEVVTKKVKVETKEYAGNVYYEVPTWVPRFGVAVRSLRAVVFSVELTDYYAYDKNKVPFLVDVVAYFRISDFRKAASRIEDEKVLQAQLENIVKGAVRTVLGQDELENIMVKRTTYGDQFTTQVRQNLEEWGLVPVKSIELMDVRDKAGEHVVDNIMQKHKSAIEKDARIKVAQNNQAAQEAEIAANQAVDLREQEKLQVVGERTANQKKAVGIAEQKAQQEIQEQTRVTTEKQMSVLRTQTLQKADIDKQEGIIRAEADQKKKDIDAETDIIVANKTKTAQTIAAQQRAEVAEKDKQATAYKAEGDLIQKQKGAEGTLAQAKADAQSTEMKGKAKGVEIRETQGAEADTLAKKNEAAVSGQILLAQKIGENAGYQNYLIEIRRVEATETVGVENAKAMGTALSNAGIKIVATPGAGESGNNGGGMFGSIMSLFGPQTAQNLNGALETLAGTEWGQKLLGKFLPLEENAPAPATPAPTAQTPTEKGGGRKNR